MGPEDYTANFASFRMYEAICRGGFGDSTILVEVRTTPQEEHIIFTVRDGRAYYAKSMHELVHALPSLESLTIQHPVMLLWDGEVKKGGLLEVYRPVVFDGPPPAASLQLTLQVDGQVYETKAVNTLQDAVWELQALTQGIAEWHLQTCFHCDFSGQARDYAVSDREYWCYRDAPDAVSEIKAKGKYASKEARFSGRFFVDAFHACAAWRPFARDGGGS